MQRDAQPGHHRVAQQLALVALEAALHPLRDLAALAVAEAPDVLPALAADQQQAVVRCQVGRRARRAVPPQVVRRCAQHAPVGRQLARDQAGIAQRADADAQVETGADQIQDLVVEVHAELHPRMQGEEFRQQRRDVLAPERGRDGHPQGAADLGGGLAQAAGERFQILHQRAPLLGERGAFGRGVQLARGPVQQAHAELALQPLEALAGHRHRQVEAARRGADRAEVEHAQEQAEVADTIHGLQSFVDND